LDKHKVMQILINFLSNAKYACDAGQKTEKMVAVRLKLVGQDRVRMEVADNGIGIAPENTKRIFSQGFTTRKGGHGFGLHSGALAAKDLGGIISAESTGIGQGATFILEIPITTPGPAKA
jgi:two-component system, NtrC family, sensor kinase